MNRIYLCIYWICSNFQVKVLLAIPGEGRNDSQEFSGHPLSHSVTRQVSEHSSAGLSLVTLMPCTRAMWTGEEKGGWKQTDQPLVPEKYHKGYVRQSINKAIMLFFWIFWCLCLSAFYNLWLCSSYINPHFYF